MGYILMYTYYRKHIDFDSKIEFNDRSIYFMDRNAPAGGVCFGEVILVRPNNDTQKRINHEYGHSIQSMILGPLFLFAVGIPSSLRVLWFRKDKVNRDYYAGYPENWADKLGGVKRERK
jgi:hypothetical protein